jgi:hypothetical protein
VKYNWGHQRPPLWFRMFAPAYAKWSTRNRPAQIIFARKLVRAHQPKGIWFIRQDGELLPATYIQFAGVSKEEGTGHTVYNWKAFAPENSGLFTGIEVDDLPVHCGVMTERSVMVQKPVEFMGDMELPGGMRGFGMKINLADLGPGGIEQAIGEALRRAMEQRDDES